MQRRKQAQRSWRIWVAQHVARIERRLGDELTAEEWDRVQRSMFCLSDELTLRRDWLGLGGKLEKGTEDGRRCLVLSEHLPDPPFVHQPAIWPYATATESEWVF